MDLVKATFDVTPIHDVVLPPLTSKVVKYLILSKEILPNLSGLVSSRDKNKPIFISNLGLNGRRLLSTGKPIKVRKFTRLSASVTFPMTKDIFNMGGGKVSTPYGEFEIYIDTMTILSRPALDTQGKNFRVRLLTPALLSSKLYLPPFLEEKYKGVDSGFSLIPSVGLLVGSAYRQYLGLLGNTSNEEKDYRTFKIIVLVNGLSKVTGFKLQPKTVVVGNDDKGRLRRTRGVEGWIEFDVVGKMKRRVALYLLYASYLGVGRSRGIGLGELEFDLVDRRREEEETQP